ncbi:ankyrin repeat and SAM domain-containing protein 1A-like isoform X8 [Pieris napi]|uniref:ankyrin repeat and SAM domain-containing protein 1A-like isoform X8 n=1 Tax=Pieris napi TaxID=78633 RepID=UPI001FB8D071|nr:ankyrin repeat and SAM domain-containing protein 1A-like isoform X8 [Pieris napi]
MDDKKVQCFGSLDICANVCDAKCHLYRKCVKAKKKLRSKLFDFDSLRRGAGVNVQDDNGYTPLHHACLRGHKEIVRLLLSVDASPCVVDKKGATPLHLAAWKGDVDIVAMLLNHNNPPVNVNHVTLDQETALLMAAQFGFVNVVAQLIAHGADVNIRNIKQESALDLAAQYGRLETVQHLLRVQPMLVQPYKYPNWKVRSFSSTPLHRASKNGHKEVVQVLLAAGIDPNIRTNSGTPLHDAACFGKASVVRILLAKGADLRALDGRGKTVEDLLADYSEEATRRVRRVIREYESMARNNYESEDDFPPFPVQDNSPTSYPQHLVIGSRRRWDEAEGTSEGDALSVSSAASSCAPMHLAHHYEHSKVSPTPPKKPPRRNLSVSPTHANSPSSGYSYELRSHARSQDDLDEIQGSKHYLKHGRSVDQYVDGKLSYMDYEENHNSPRAIPVPNPRPSLKTRTQPVAITAMYENVVIKEQNPRRKLRRNNFGPQSEDTIERVKKYSNQERSSLESLLDDQSMNSPSDCERYCDGPKIDIPLSPSHYEQPPTPDHPPPSAKQAERSIHERIRPLSQEYKRRSTLRDSQTETDISLLRAASAVSVASGATDRSGNTDNCVEEYVCDVPFAGLFKGSTTTLDGIGLRPMPAERPKTLRKLKSVYDASPTEPTNVNTNSSNGQVDRSFNGTEDEVRRRSNTTSSSHSGDKSLSILSPFDEQEEWAKISEIMASFGSKLVRESVFVSELEQEFTNRLGLSCSESSLSPSVASSLGLWLSGLGLHDYEPLFIDSGYDDIEFVNGILDENDLREMGIEENDRQKILESSKQLPLKITEISNNHNNNVIKNQYGSVDEWLRNINLEQYSETFRKHLYVDMDRVRRIWEVELTAVLEINKPGHRKRILCSVSGEHNGPANNIEDINADLNNLKNNIQQLKDEIKEKLPPSENLKPVPPPVVPTLAPPGGETLKRSKKNRPAPQPPRPSDLEIRAPSELLVGVPGALKTQWKHQPFVLVTGAVTYVANYLGSTVVKELRGTESTKKSIQKLKKTTKEPRDSPDIILSISYRGVKFLNTITRELVCEHEIRNIHCACQDADDLTHFAYITKDHTTKSHYCHVFRVATMDQATEVILTLGEAFEVAYQMALREQAIKSKVTQSITKTPQHEVKEKPYHGRSHSITEIKLNGHQLKIAPIAASLSNEDFQKDGSKSPRTPLLKAPIASTEEL